MTIPPEFIEGDVPLEFEDLIIRDITALQGEWQETLDKPLDKVVAILSRLGLSGVKTKIAARTLNKVEIALLKQGSVVTDANEVRSPSTMMPSAENSPPSSRRDSDEAASTPTSPTYLDSQHPEWQQTQYFPMGRIRTVKFVSDGTTLHEQFEPDTTTTWQQKSIWSSGKLIQRRENETLRLIMYDTRCVLRKRPEAETDGQSQEEPQPVQAFQWKIIDQNTGEVLSCILYLDPLPLHV